MRMLQRLGLILILGGVLTTCHEDKDDEIVIGLLLPFTGSGASGAYNLERAAIMAADRVNNGGGINGRPVRIYTRDTGSQKKRSLQALNELLDKDAVAMLGLESAEGSRAVLPAASKYQRLFTSPFIAASDVEVSADFPWWRLAPSARTLGESVAKEAYASGVTEMAVVSSEGEYNVAFTEGVKSKFTSLGGLVVAELTLSSDQMSYADKARLLDLGDNNAVVLSTSPGTGARFVNELGLARSDKVIGWWLSPLLQSDELIMNTLPNLLEGARGVAPGVFLGGEDFIEAFKRRWSGDVPMRGAFYYYDAVALVSLGLQTAWAMETAKTATNSLPSLTNIIEGMHRVTTFSGRQVGWSDLNKAMAMIKRGEPVFYQGVTGGITWDELGARKMYLFDSWTIRNGKIIVSELGNDG